MPLTQGRHALGGQRYGSFAGRGPTRLYIDTTGETPPFEPPPNSMWDDLTLATYPSLMMFDTPTTEVYPLTLIMDPSFYGPSLGRILVSRPLEVGQTLSSMGMSAQFLVSDTAGTKFFLFGIRILASNGTTERRDLGTWGSNIVANTTLMNRMCNGSLVFADYTTVLGDRLVIDIGFGGTDIAGVFTIECGSDTGIDLPIDNTTITHGRPWIEFDRSILFTDELVISNNATSLMWMMIEEREQWL